MRIVKLPSGYRQVEYIQSTGTQYIDTGFKPNQNTGVTIDFQLNSVSDWQCIYGARTGNNTKTYALWHSGSAFGFYYANANTTFSNLDGTARHTVAATKNTAIADGTSSVSLNYSNFTADYLMYLFAVNSDGTVKSNASMKLFACQIYDNGVLVRDFIPVEIDGVVGLWDAISGVLYENAGSGTFIAGPAEVIETPADFEQILAVYLKWAPVKCEGYKIYRNGALLGTTSDTFYVDLSAEENETYIYSLFAYYGERESEPAELTVYTRSGYFTIKPLIQSAFFQ